MSKQALHYFLGQEDRYRDLADTIVQKAVKAGADQAEVYLEWGQKTEIQVRMQEVESIKQSSSKGFGLRVFKGGGLGFVSSTDFSSDAVNLMVKQAVRLAKIGGADEHHGLPEVHRTGAVDLELFDDTCLIMKTERKIQLAREMESAALDADRRITNSEGSVFRDACKGTAIANSEGMLDSFFKSAYSMYCAPVVESGNERRYNYWYSSATRFAALEPAEAIGKRAAERAVRMLGARKTRSRKVPVIFDSLVASGFIGTVMSCVNGEARHKKETCLWDKRDRVVASRFVSIIDHGDLQGQVGSLPFDGEGIPPKKRAIIDRGRLTGFLYDSYSARKDGARSTGNGLRTYHTLPTIQGTNFYLENGADTPEEIIKDVPEGLYVTGMIGFGVNIVTGDYSRGAEGVWIENGELAYPVHEVTVSGNIIEMLRGIEAVGDDLRLVSAASAPTILIGSMVVSGT